jgi:recombination DNA repair RAD52 pathway protein
MKRELHPERIAVLVRGINPVRVMSRTQAGFKLSYLTQADVRATAIKIFGFGGFSVDTRYVETVIDEQVPTKGPGEGFNWYCAVRALVRVTIHETEAVYTEAAVGGSTQPTHHEALDMATKTAVSDAMKRCFVNLGDQFGLSLYFNGSTAPVVRGLYVPPETQERGSTAPGNQVAVVDADTPAPQEGDFVAEGAT